MNENAYLWNVSLPVYIPSEQNLEAVETLQTHDQILLDANFWTKEECIAYRLFESTVMDSVKNPEAFLEGYREQKKARETPSSLIIPGKKTLYTP